MKGFYLALEGGEGAGKTTIAEYLRSALEAQGRDVVVVREPGSTDLGNAIRQLVLHSMEMDPWAEAFLFATQRAQLIAEVVRPALESGKVIISDRSFYSSLAYQGGARGLGIERVRALNLAAVEGVVPDRVVVLGVDPEVGMARQDDPDRIGREKAEFQARVAAAYLELAAQEPDRVVIVPASDEPELVSKRILELMDR
jgi:dTMP kinase